MKEEKDWYEFVDQFFIYLSAIPRVKGVPLAAIWNNSFQVLEAEYNRREAETLNPF